MIGTAVQDFGVQIGSGMIDEAAEKIFDKLSLQIADQARFHQVFIDQCGTPAKVDRYHCQGLIHGKDKVSRAVDSLSVSESFREQLPKHDSHVLNGVMLIHIKITLRCKL